MADVINWFPGHMAKAKREIEGQLRLVDIVLELRDARIPFSSSNPMINEICGNKKRLILLCKSSLADKDITSKWIKYYNDNGIDCLDIDSITGRNINLIVKKCYECLKETFEKRKAKGIVSKEIKAMVLGIPNVGKSTLINRLVGRKATNVGNKPGITKSLEWIRINKDLELLDTPGILWPKLETNEIALNLASMTAIKEEILNKEEVCIHIINKMIKLYPDSFKERYKLDNLNIDIVEILDIIGKSIGAIRNKETDYEKVYTVILKDLREGYLGRVTFDEYEDR